MRRATTMMIFVSTLLSAAIFGFFYAWVCSTMWGLDAADPRVAIAAMQAMNASVRNVVFAPAFFATPVVLVLAAALALARRLPRAALLFGVAALVYAAGALAPTLLVNVPMNEALAAVDPAAPDAAAIWSEYSRPWQFWNQVRTAASGLCLLVVGAGLYLLRAPSPVRHPR